MTKTFTHDFDRLLDPLGFFSDEARPEHSREFRRKLDNDIDLLRQAQIRSISFTDTEDQFVESGLRAIFPVRESFSTWESLAGGRIMIWQNIMKTMFTGYLLEMESGHATSFTPARILSTHEQLLSVTQLSPKIASYLRHCARAHAFIPMR